MYRKRLAALLMTGCLFTTAGCSTPSSSTGSGPLGFGLFSGCCGHSSRGASAPAVAAMPVSGSYGGVDCPCSHHGGGAGVYHPAVMSQGMASAPVSSGVVMGDMNMNLPPSFPAQQYQSQPIPVTTPGMPPNMGQPYAPGPVPNPPPRIQPVPNSGVGPAAGFAPQTQWGPQH